MGHHVVLYFLAMLIIWDAAVVSIAMVWSRCVSRGVLTRWYGFLRHGSAVANAARGLPWCDPWHATVSPTLPWNPMPRHGMPWGCHDMPWVVPWSCLERVK